MGSSSRRRGSTARMGAQLWVPLGSVLGVQAGTGLTFTALPARSWCLVTVGLQLPSGPQSCSSASHFPHLGMVYPLCTLVLGVLLATESPCSLPVAPQGPSYAQ